MKYIKKDDFVYVLSGNEKGKTGKVIAKRDNRIIVEGVNIRKKNVKKSQKGSAQVVNIEMPIHISNVALCTNEGKKIKAKVKLNADKTKELVYEENGKSQEYRKIKKK